MSRKQIGSLVGAVILAVIAPLLTLALLHSLEGTARADAPPATYWKVSMPDLGQHSTGWCWAGAAANSFWWFAHNTTGQDGLLGGGAHPWEAIDAASTNPQSFCGAGGTWFDSRDALPPGGDGAAIPGYATVLKMIAVSTFKDKVQDGFRDPDGADNIAGNADDEVNYCYSEGVEKWDYLIGLRDYVNNYGHSLVVHDIIDPAKCGINTGLIVNRAAPTMNSRNPCGPGNSGVPGVNQMVVPPAFGNYMTELYHGQDVLLWVELPYPETAHVVTGVGYDNTPGAGAFHFGTVTISDPWTHTTNPPVPGVPSASHTDGLPPLWQSKPDHNTSPNHGTLPATEPYNLCDVTQVAPLKIQCYDEDTGTPRVWSVVDMIFVSPLEDEEPVGGLAELPDVSGSSGANNLLLAGLASAGVAAVIAGAWYARRRWQR